MNGRERITNSYFHEVATNPNDPCPREILDQIMGVRATFLSYNGADIDGIIEVHKDIVDDVKQFFALAYELGFPFNEVLPASKALIPFSDLSLMNQNISSGFNYRTIVDSDELSLHALGRAIDINPRRNPYRLYDQAGKLIKTLPGNWLSSADDAGELTPNHELVRLMRSLGWEWGGDWKPESGRVDLHHFQKPK